MGILQYPYSCTLLVKKADLLIANRQYKRALVLLDKAEILDRNDIDIYVLRTDAYLALDMQDKAVALLEDAISQLQKIKNEHQIGKVKHNDGTSSKVDVQTAHAILTVHKSLNDENKKKFAAMVGKSNQHLQKAAEFSWKNMKW